MKVLFDTSVLVAAMLVKHPQHIPCLSWLQQANTKQIAGLIATHTLAEVYAVLTRFPLSPRIPPQLAQRLMTDNLHQFEVVSLTVEDYQTVINQMVHLNFTGGSIYDAIIAQAASKASVAVLLTLNPNHFTRLGDGIAERVRIPH